MKLSFKNGGIQCYQESSVVLVVITLTIGPGQGCSPPRHISPIHLEIRSPNFGPGKTYPSNTKCSWDVIIPVGKKAKLSFFFFDLEHTPGCNCDGVELFEGRCSQGGKSILRHCGIVSPVPVTVEGAVCVKFWSDAEGQKLGFQLKVFFIRTAQSTKSSNSRSSETLYSNQEPFIYETNGKGGNNFQSRKLQLMARVKTSPVKIVPQRTRAATTQSGALTTFNTYQSSPMRTTTMRVLQQSIESTTKRPSTKSETTSATEGKNTVTEALADMGRIVYYPKCSPDGVVVGAPRGTIISPNYGKGKVYPTSTICKWIIKAYNNKRIEISFTDFDLELEENCSWDSVTLYTGDNPSEENAVGRFCGGKRPSNMTSAGGTVTVVFKSDRIISQKGFVLNYRVIQGSNTECGLKATVPTMNYHIFGGTLADDGEVPWMVSIRHDGTHECGGALISPDWVMTAAHCIDRIQLSPYRVSILTGSSFVSGGSKFTQVRTASEIIIHSTYRYAKSGDVALIRLLKPIRFTDFSRPICLPEGSQAVIQDSCFIAGWGATSKEGSKYSSSSPKLQKASIDVWSQNDCHKAYPGRVSEDVFCAAGKGGRTDSCKGDSGGPLMCQGMSARWHAIGLVSWGGRCGEAAEPGVYTGLRKYSTWIRDVTAEEGEYHEVS